MTLKTSLIITGDSSIAKAAVSDLAKAVDAAAAGTRAAVVPAQQLDAAQKSVSVSARDQAKAVSDVDTALADAAKSARQLSTVNGAVATSNGGSSRSIRELTKAVNDNEAAARRQQFAIRNAGQQVGDFGLSVAAGISPAQAFAQQAGQMGYALSEMNGKLGAVGTFLTGPWGIALTIGAAVLAPMIGKLFETAEAAKAVELGSSGMADAQGALGQVFDLTTGKLKKQNVELAAANELMRLNIRLAVNAVAAQTTRTTSALDKLAVSATGTASALSGTPQAKPAADPFQNNAPSLAALGASPLLLDLLHQYVQEQTPSVVYGDRGKAGLPDKPKIEPFSAAFAKIGTDIAGLFTKPENARQLGLTIGKFAGRGLEGAATGSIVAGLGKSIGVNLSQGGASLGGALGGVLGGIKGVTSALGPFGAALTPVLSIAGGLVGKLLAGKAKPGGATVSATGGEAGVTGSVGSDKGAISTGTGLGGQVASTLNQLVGKLGANLGDFSVQIGKYKDDLRVNVNGKALGGVKGSGASGFGDDENAAINFAVTQAIAQGAVTGVSAAVAKALKSSTDVDKALKEALKVQDLELTIGGIGAQFDKAFKDFEAQAKERVRIASAYGFDVVAIEKRNAEDRVKLTDQLVKSQVGSLQSLLGELTQGSLFEGSALDKIGALNTAIGKAKTDLDNNVDGAADTLAGLYQQRLAASKDAYGSTSGYVVDRNSTINEAQALIARANAAAVKAGGTTDPALATTNAVLKSSNDALDEANDQNAAMISELRESNLLLRQMLVATGTSSGFDLKKLAAT